MTPTDKISPSPEEALQRPAKAAGDSPATAGAAQGDARGEAPEDVWRESSLELNTGLQVTDFSDSLPADQFNELFKP